MKCQKCGVEIPEGKIYCEKCGTAIQMVPDYNPEEDIPIGTEERKKVKSEDKDKEQTERHFYRYLFALLGLIIVGVVSYHNFYQLFYQPLQEVKAEPASVILLDKPKLNVPSGVYKYSPRLIISHSEEENGSIYYTMDGTTPDSNSKMYENPIEIGEGTTIIRAIFIRSDGRQSEEVDGTYEVNFSFPDAPKISVPAGNYTGEIRVSLSAEEGCSIYYTTNGDEPNYQSKLYQWPITIKPGYTLLQAVAVDKDGEMSETVQAVYQVEEIPATDIPAETGIPPV